MGDGGDEKLRLGNFHSMRLDNSISKRYQMLIKKEFLRQEISTDYLDQKFNDAGTVGKKASRTKSKSYKYLKEELQNQQRTLSRSKVDRMMTRRKSFKASKINQL